MKLSKLIEAVQPKRIAHVENQTGALADPEIDSIHYRAQDVTTGGLFVAIPAVWFYNYLTGKIEYFNVEMDNSSSELVDYFIKKS